jgi:hypothetical protein
MLEQEDPISSAPIVHKYEGVAMMVPAHGLDGPNKIHVHKFKWFISPREGGLEWFSFELADLTSLTETGWCWSL